MDDPQEKKVDGPQLTFGRYVVVRELGKGAMGEVYLAHDPVLDRKVALKVIAIDPNLDRATREEYFARFSCEAKSSAKLNHASIVAVFDAGEQNGLPWIAFQYVEGETLEKLLGRRGTLPIKRCVAFAQDIASALEHAHSWNIVHRDVKPANILIENSTGIAKLADFGIVKAPWTAMTQEGDTLGSPGYMSPEQIDGSELDERADLFCLGVVLYQMLSGRHPFLRDTVAGTAYATCNGAYAPLREIASDVPPALDWAVRKCLAADRRKRIGSATELISLFKTVALPVEKPMQSPAGKKTAPNLTGLAKATLQYFGKTSPTRREPANDRLVWLKIRHWLYRIEKPVAGLWKSLCGLMVLPAHKTIIAMTATFRQPGGPHLPKFITRWVPALKGVERSFMAFVLFWGSLAGIIIIICVGVVGLMINPPALREGSKEAQLLQQCSDALEKNNREAALEAGHKLTSMNPVHPQSYIALARIMIREEKYDTATSDFIRTLTLRGGKKTLKKAMPVILLEICRQLKKGPAPVPLLDMTVHTLSAAGHPLVRSWIKDSNHWLRWNAVEILKMSNVDVDVVPVYIQDLSFAGSVQVRLSAVDSLGKIGDKRAIPALKKVLALDQNDPLASAEAGKVLEENFK